MMQMAHVDIYSIFFLSHGIMSGSVITMIIIKKTGLVSHLFMIRKKVELVRLIMIESHRAL